MLGVLLNCLDFLGKRLVKFNKGYIVFSQSLDENLVFFDFDSDGELEFRYFFGYFFVEQVNQDVSWQLFQDGYYLDEILDDEDLDFIFFKFMVFLVCFCCWCCFGDFFFCIFQQILFFKMGFVYYEVYRVLLVIQFIECSEYWSC